MFVLVALVALAALLAPVEAQALSARKIEIIPYSSYNGSFVLVVDSDLLGPAKGAYVSLDEYCRSRLPTWFMYSAGRDYVVWRVSWKPNTTYTYYLCYGDVVSSVDPRDIFYIVLPGANYTVVGLDGDDTVVVNSTGIYVYARASAPFTEVAQSYDTGVWFYDTGVYLVYDFGRPVTPVNATLSINVYDSDWDTYYVYVYLDGSIYARYYQRRSITVDLSGLTFQSVAVRVYDTERNDWVRAWGWFNATIADYVVDYAALQLDLAQLASLAGINVTGRWLVIFHQQRLEPLDGHVGLAFVNGPTLSINLTNTTLAYQDVTVSRPSYLGGGSGVFGYRADSVWASVTGEGYDELLSILAATGNYTLLLIYANVSGYGNLTSGLHLGYLLVTPVFEDYEIFIGPEYEVPVSVQPAGIVVYGGGSRELAVIASLLSLAGAMYFFARAFIDRKLVWIAVYEALILTSVIGLLLTEQYKLVPWIAVLTMLPVALVLRDLAEALSILLKKL